MVHQKLSRTATHRASLLRNLVTSLIEHESITTTHAKAKEAQTFAERLITRARRAQEKNQTWHETSQNLQNYLYKPKESLPKLMQLATRYKSRTGGYTRILRLERRLGDNAPQSILELVGGSRDMRTALTARTVARYEAQNAELDNVTRKNVEKLCKDDEAGFRALVDEMKEVFYTEDKLKDLPLPPNQQPKMKAPIQVLENPKAAKSA